MKHPMHLTCLFALGLCLGAGTVAIAGEGKGGHRSPPVRPDKPDRPPVIVGGSTAEGRSESDSNDLFVTKLVDYEGTVTLDVFTELQLNRRLAHLKEAYLKALAEWEDAQKLAQQAGEKLEQPKPAKPDYKFVKVRGWRNAEELLVKLRRQQAEEELKKRREETTKEDAPKAAAAKGDLPKGDPPKADPPKETVAATKTDTSKEGDAILERIQKVLDKAAPAPKP